MNSNPKRSDQAALARMLWLIACLLSLSACRSVPVPQAAPAPAPLAATAALPPNIACNAGERPMVRDALYLGRNRPGGTVSDAQWRTFVDDAVVPRFPDGFTVIQAEGHWRSGSGAIEGEASQVLIVLHADDADSRAAVAALAADYKRQFQQEAVLRERSPACVTF
jgi:hypothetical protein